MKDVTKVLDWLEVRLFAGAEPDQVAVAKEHRAPLEQARDQQQAARASLQSEWAALHARWFGVAPEAEGLPAIRYEHAMRSRAYKVFGWVALVAEAALAAGVATGWITGWILLAVPAAVGIAAFICWMAKVWWTAGFDSLVPRVGCASRERTVLLLSAVVVLLSGAFGLVRFFPLAGVVLLVVLGLLSALLPILAGGCFSLANIFDERNAGC